MKNFKVKFWLVVVVFVLLVNWCAGPVFAVRVLYQSWDTNIYLGKPFNSLEFEDPFAVGKYVQGYRIVDWRDADYNKTGHPTYDEWTVVGAGTIDGNVNEIWMRQSGQIITTTTLVPSSVISVHLVGDNNDGKAEIMVDGVLKARLDMGNRNGSRTALVIVRYLGWSTHTIDVNDMGVGPSNLGDDVATLGACALGHRKRFPRFWYPDGIIRIQPTWDYIANVDIPVYVPMGYWSGWWWWHHQCHWFRPWYGGIGRYWPWYRSYYPYWKYWDYWPYYRYRSPWWQYWRWQGGPYFWGYKKCLHYRYLHWRPVTVYWWGWYWDPPGEGNCVELLLMADEKDPGGGRILPVTDEVANNLIVDQHQFTVNGEQDEDMNTGDYTPLEWVEVGAGGINLRTHFETTTGSEPNEVDAFMESEIVQRLIQNTEGNPTAKVGFQYASWQHDQFVAPLEISPEIAYVTENGDELWCQVMLKEPPMDLSGTRVTVLPSSTEIQLGQGSSFLDPGEKLELFFFPGYWETAQTIKIKAQDNVSVEGGDIATFVSFIMGDNMGNYQRRGVSMEVIVQDDEPGGLGFAESDNNHDGKVNLIDLSKMADEWLSCTDPDQTPTP